MSGATLTGLGGREAQRLGDDVDPRRSFGRRRAVAGDNSRDLGPRSFDRGVADLRRRIDASHSALPSRLPWAIGGTVIVGLSLALWMDAFQVATTLARNLAQLF